MNVKIDRSRYGYVYKITNLINGKTYVGQRKIVRDKTWEDYYGSGKLIKQAIAKYGKENFLKELISYADSQEELLELEAESITAFRLEGACEYNLAIYSPPPDNHQNASPEFKKLWYKNISDSLKSTLTSEAYVHYSTKQFEQRYKDFTSKTPVSDVLEFYSDVLNIRETARHFLTSYKMINKILEENNVEKVNRTEQGYKRSEEERLNISNKARERLGLDLIEEFKKCIVCSKALEINNKTLLCIAHYTQHKSSVPDNKIKELVQLIAEGTSIREMSRVTGVSKPKIRKFMVDNGYEIPKQSADAAHKARKGSISENALFIDCLICGKTVRSKKKTPDRIRKYCSVECRGIANRKS